MKRKYILILHFSQRYAVKGHQLQHCSHLLTEFWWEHFGVFGLLELLILLVGLWETRDTGVIQSELYQWLLYSEGKRIFLSHIKASFPYEPDIEI